MSHRAFSVCSVPRHRAAPCGSKWMKVFWMPPFFRQAAFSEAF
ncbi:hypothetical protein SXCC_04013 [Gluconacetobacter sp. SXCC-1]|nr:hypothetical protein SXCC_04013 [Gluconacetobacter sp. SXCC-1]